MAVWTPEPTQIDSQGSGRSHPCPLGDLAHGGGIGGPGNSQEEMDVASRREGSSFDARPAESVVWIHFGGCNW